MPRFELQKQAVVVRGQIITVQEMTAAQKMAWSKAVQADPTVTLALAVSMCAQFDPPLTLEEALLEPTIVIEELAVPALRLSGLSVSVGGEDDGEKKVSYPKKT